MKTIAWIQREGKMRDVSRRALATAPDAAEVVGWS